MQVDIAEQRGGELRCPRGRQLHSELEPVVPRSLLMNSGSLRWLCIRDGRLQSDFAVGAHVEYRLGPPRRRPLPRPGDLSERPVSSH